MNYDLEAMSGECEQDGADEHLRLTLVSFPQWHSTDSPGPVLSISFDNIS